jgi:hypothetical protein
LALSFNGEDIFRHVTGIKDGISRKAPIYYGIGHPSTPGKEDKRGLNVTGVTARPSCLTDRTATPHQLLFLR